MNQPAAEAQAPAAAQSAANGIDPAAAPAPPPDAPQSAAPTPEETAAGATERDDKGRFRNPLQPRIDELTRARRESEREAMYWKAQAQANAAPPPAPPKAPVPEDFADYGEYVTALTRFNGEAIAREIIAEDRQQTRAQTEAEQRAQAWRERTSSAAKAIPDLPAVLAASDVLIAGFVQRELLESDLGPQIAYHLDKNPALAEKLNAMTPTQAAKEIGRLEVQLAAPAAKSADAPAEMQSTAPTLPSAQNRRVSSAPAPIRPVSQGRSTQVDLAKAGMEEYVATRKAQGAIWAR